MVGLGESVHTSGGYYEMKHRLFRYLVEELGFRAFAFESPWSSALETGEYVASCAGNPREATRSLFGVWQAQEVADLLAWMCDWNRRHPRDRVVFFGYDIQQGPDDREALLELFVSFGLAPSDPRLAGLRRCLPAGSGSRPTADQTTDCLAALDALGPELPALAEAAGLPPRELAFARLRFVSLRAHVEKQHLQDDFPASYAARDAGMAEVLFTLRDLLAPGARTAVWAHNGHVGKGRPYRLLSMGTHLDEELGKDYVVLGLTASRALIDWPGQGCGDASGGHPPDSVERRLAGLGAPYLLVDLDFPGAAEPFLAPGVPYSLDRQLTVPRTHYDALVYLDLSPAMTPLFRAPCR
jgi:erythromycin esterase